MPNTIKQTLREGYDRLKKTVEKIINPKKKEQLPHLVLQPYRDKKYFEGYWSQLIFLNLAYQQKKTLCLKGFFNYVKIVIAGFLYFISSDTHILF